MVGDGKKEGDPGKAISLSLLEFGVETHTNWDNGWYISGRRR